MGWCHCFPSFLSTPDLGPCFLITFPLMTNSEVFECILFYCSHLCNKNVVLSYVWLEINSLLLCLGGFRHGVPGREGAVSLSKRHPAMCCSEFSRAHHSGEQMLLTEIGTYQVPCKCWFCVNSPLQPDPADGRMIHTLQKRKLRR